MSGCHFNDPTLTFIVKTDGSHELRLKIMNYHDPNDEGVFVDFDKRTALLIADEIRRVALALPGGS